MGVARVLYAIDTLKIGGAQYHLRDVVCGLDTLRFQPLVCALGPETELSNALEQRGVSVHCVGLKNIYGRRALDNFPKLIRWIKKNQVDLVHTYLPSANIYASLAARFAGVRNIVTSRRDMGFSRSSRVAILEQLLVNPIARRVVAVSESVARTASEEWFLGPGRIVTIYNGVDLESSRPRAVQQSSRDIRKSLGVEAEAQLVTIVATLSPVKAHEVFLEAAATVARSNLEAEFILVGDGPRRAEYEQWVHQNNLSEVVHFTGQLPKESIDEILDATDIGVLTSDTEGMSNALLDFMAHGKPVVATRVGGNPEVVADGLSGLLVPPRNPPALAYALLSLLRNPSRAAQMGREGRRRVESEFTRDRLLQSLQSLYEDVLGVRHLSGSSPATSPVLERSEE